MAEAACAARRPYSAAWYDRSATGRPSRCRDTRSGPHTAGHGHSPPAYRRSRYRPVRCSTRRGRAQHPRHESRGSRPASAPHRRGAPTRRSRRFRRDWARSTATRGPAARGAGPAAQRHPPSRSLRRSFPRIAHGRHPEPSDQVDDVATPAVGVGGRMAGLVDPAVDRPAHVLDERPEDTFVDGGDRAGRVDLRPGVSQARSRSGSAAARGGGSSAPTRPCFPPKEWAGRLSRPPVVPGLRVIHSRGGYCVAAASVRVWQTFSGVSFARAPRRRQPDRSLHRAPVPRHPP